MDSKLSNPKDHFGSKKIDISLVPFTLIVSAARAFMEGALKYGRFNWRIAGVRASIYHSALQRHLAKWWNGQNADKKTRVHHLDSAIACLAIIRDAELYGKLTDDRPPCPDPDKMADLIDSCEGDVAFLKELMKDEDPHQYTIADTELKQQPMPTKFVCGNPDRTCHEWTIGLDHAVRCKWCGVNELLV